MKAIPVLILDLSQIELIEEEVKGLFWISIGNRPLEFHYCLFIFRFLLAHRFS